MYIETSAHILTVQQLYQNMLATLVSRSGGRPVLGIQEPPWIPLRSLPSRPLKENQCLDLLVLPVLKFHSSEITWDVFWYLISFIQHYVAEIHPYCFHIIVNNSFLYSIAIYEYITISLALLLLIGI